MIAVVSRVLSAQVSVDGAVLGELTAPGLLVLVGVHTGDCPAQVALLVRKVAELRLLRGERSVRDAGAGVLLISQFTLCADTRRGRRPSFMAAARPEVAEPLVEAVVQGLRGRGVVVSTGRFGAEMTLTSVGDGPFTVLVQT